VKINKFDIGKYLLFLEKGYVKHEDSVFYCQKNRPFDTPEYSAKKIKKSCKNEKKVFLNIASNYGNIYVCMFNAILQSNK